MFELTYSARREAYTTLVKKGLYGKVIQELGYKPSGWFDGFQEAHFIVQSTYGHNGEQEIVVSESGVFPASGGGRVRPVSDSIIADDMVAEQMRRDPERFVKWRKAVKLNRAKVGWFD